MKNELISIVIPVYNGEKFIDRCLNTVINQTYENIEIIMVNDGSKDSTQNILEYRKNKDKRIKIISQNNHGLSYSRNVGINNATGEYITFIDIDDFIKQDYVECFYKEHRGYDIVIGGFIKYWGNKSIEMFVGDSRLGIYLDTNPRARFYKLSFIKENKLYFPNGLLREDVIFSINAYNHTDKIKVIDYAGYYYFLDNSESITHRIFKNFDPLFIKRLKNLKNIKPVSLEDESLIEYSVIRCAIMYLLYSGGFRTSKEFIKEYDRIFGWIKENYPNYRKNEYTSIFRLNSEKTLFFKIGIRSFLVLDKIKLVPLFSKIYCIKNGK